MSRLSSILLDWYKHNKRDLPWRNTTDPYFIWLSEVILQQTRVDQGYNYYIRFVERYPTVLDLAQAEEDEVLKLWQGLGYYSRARNLLAAAKIIKEQYQGRFPRDYKDVLSLKGVGEYTAAAIVSAAYNDPYAVVDGNVYRVLSRIFAIDTPIDTTLGKKEFASLAQELLDKKHPGEYNQSIMDFGALQCVPASPNCFLCPANEICLAFAQNKVSVYPVKQGKVKVRDRYFNYFDVRSRNNRYLNKRTAKDIWQNLYEFPMIETESMMSLSELETTPVYKDLLEGVVVKDVKLVDQRKHILSHQRIHANFYQVDIDGDILSNRYLKISNEELVIFAIPQLIHNYLLNNS